MTRSFTHCFFAFAAAFSLLAVSARLSADEPQKPAEPAVQKADPQTPPAKLPQRQPKPWNELDTPVGPTPGAVKPHTHAASGTDIPPPTVQLKEGEVPGIKFDTPTFDFGRIRAGQDVVHDFWFTNTGTGPLEILKVRPSCGCTTAGQHDRIVQPGQSGKIPIRMNVGNTSGPTHKTIVINTNCPTEGASVTLHIQGEVWQMIQATPNSASFGRLTTEMINASNLERRLTIVNNTDEKIEITEVKSTNPSFKADLKELEEGKKFELVVTIAGQISNGPVTGNIEVKTTLADMPKVQIPVNAYVTSDVDVTPNQLTLPANRSGDLQRQFFIRNNTPNPVKLSDVDTSNPDLKMTLVETQPVGKAYRLTVDIPAEYQVSEGGDTITLATDNPSVPRLTIPITQAPSMADVSRQFQQTKMTPAVDPATTPPAQPTAGGDGQPAAARSKE